MSVYFEMSSRLQFIVAELNDDGNGIVQNSLQVLSVVADYPGMLNCDLYYSRKRDEAIPFSSQIGDDTGQMMVGNFYLKMIDGNYLHTQQIIQPAVAIIIADEQLYEDGTLMSLLEFHASQYAYIIVLGGTGIDASRLRFDCQGKFIVISSYAESGLESALNAHLNEDLRIQLQKLAILRGLGFITKQVRSIYDSKKSECIFLKLEKEKLNDKTKELENEVNISEKVSEVKSKIQNWAKILERTMKRNYEELLRPTIGHFTKQMTNWISPMSLEDINRKEIAEKSEKYVTEIKKVFLDAFEKKLRGELMVFFEQDKTDILKSYGELRLRTLNDVNRLKIGDIDADAFKDDSSLFPDSSRTINTYLYFGRNYSGELLKKGFTEYFVALREYAGVIMMAVSLLAPLFMISQAVDKEWGHQNNASGKTEITPWEYFIAGLGHFSTMIRILSGVLSLTMIVYGVFKLRKLIPQKRKEDEIREIARAQESLNSEGKRIISDCTKDWTANVLQWSGDTSEALLTKVETLSKDYIWKKKKELSDLKLLFQDKSKVYENMDSKLKSVDRNIEEFKKKYDDMRKELERKYSPVSIV